MRVVQVREFGGPEVLAPGEVPEPDPGEGQVLVAVEAADVLFLDAMLRRGAGPAFGVEPPYVPGGGIAGTVLGTGPGADPAWRGRRVAARLGVRGGYGERAAVDAADLVEVPAAVDVRTAAALVHDGPTALALLELTAPAAGERVLITGASGGMGLLLLQLLRQRGAVPVAAARGERKRTLVRAAGAGAVVDPGAPGWTDEVLAAGGAVDVVLDGAGGDVGRAALGVLRDGGRFSAHGAAAGGFAGLDADEVRRRGVVRFGIEHVRFSRERGRELLARSLELAADGLLRPHVGQVFALEDARRAHAALDGREVEGKTLLVA